MTQAKTKTTQTTTTEQVVNDGVVATAINYEYRAAQVADLAVPPAPAPDLLAGGFVNLAGERVAPPPSDATNALPPAPSPEPTGFVPLRIWTGGPGTPQDKIFIPGRSAGLRPGADFAYLVKSQEDYDILKRAIGKNKMWADDIDPSDPPEKCTTCQWKSRSYRAMNYHLNNAHGRPQD